MKRTFLIVLCLCMLLSLCSCAKKKNNEPDIDEETGKKIITIANIYPTRSDDEINKYVYSFNKSNTEYKAVVANYTGIDFDEWIQSDGGIAVVDNAAAKLSAEMMAGKVPDVILVTPKTPVYSFAQKGLLANIYDLMDNDPDFHSEDYLQNIFSASEIDGKLYEIAPYFFLSGIFAKKSEVENNSWITDEVYTYISSKPDSKYILAQMTQKGFIIASVSNLFNDFDITKVDFDADKIKETLKISERFITEYVEDVNVGKYDLWFGAKDGDPIMFPYSLDNFSTLKEYETLYFGEEVTMKGWFGHNNPSINLTNSVLITNNSKNQAGAWEYVKHMLDTHEDVQYAFPVKLSQLEKLADTAKQSDSKYTVFDKGIDYEISNNTDEDNAKIMNILTSADNVGHYDDNITMIIEEEVDFYLDGHKTANEFIDVVQNRINLYINEVS